MSEKKGWTKSFKGLFVMPEPESGEGAGAPTGPAPDAQDGAAPGAGQEEWAPPAQDGGLATGAGIAPGGKLDLSAIYTAAGIDPEEQARVTKAAELLHALPAGSEPARQIVEASLKAFGVPVEKILSTGERQNRALDTYAEADAADTRKGLDEGNQRIAQYEQEIKRIRQVMDERVAAQQAVERACAAAKLELVRVLGFFGHAPAARPGAAAPAPADPSKPRTT